jgi:hypothetical protein
VQTSSNVDRRFLGFVSELLLCSRCFGNGVRRHVVQVISPRHRPRTLCRDCAARAPHH